MQVKLIATKTGLRLFVNHRFDIEANGLKINCLLETGKRFISVFCLVSNNPHHHAARLCDPEQLTGDSFKIESKTVVGSEIIVRRGCHGQINAIRREGLQYYCAITCDYFIEFDEAELAKCPECSRYALELYSLYDHMRYQCTRKAQDKETLIAAGCGMYIGDLM